MARFVAFLRAINVGGHVVKMDRLRELFEAMGFGNVETFIASGNVVFDSAARNVASLEAKIERELESALGYEVATFLRTTAELAAAASREPFPRRDEATLYIGFLARPLSKEQVKTVEGFRSSVDEFAVHGRELYWSCSVKSMDSEFSLARLERALKIQATFRNANTVRKMAGKFAS
ncbi:MAG: DUF1697 domain-containing protein [Thermoanaerobaculia bacterium]|nr:DUF1697 domain-containing protein [Thermoanaerobaculia bacterium]